MRSAPYGGRIPSVVRAIEDSQAQWRLPKKLRDVAWSVLVSKIYQRRGRTFLAIGWFVFPPRFGCARMAEQAWPCHVLVTPVAEAAHGQRADRSPRNRSVAADKRWTRSSVDVDGTSAVFAENQMATIAVYAAKHDLAIVRTYRAEGRSGLLGWKSHHRDRGYPATNCASWTMSSIPSGRRKRR